MTIQDEIAALPREPKGPGFADEDIADYWADKCDYYEARLVIAERLLQELLPRTVPATLSTGAMLESIAAIADARAYLAAREGEK